MKVTGFSMRALSVPLYRPFKIALRETSTTEVAIVRLETDTGLVGYGEAAPEPAVTGETLQIIMAALPVLAEAVQGIDPFAIERAHERMDRALAGNTAAKCAIDLALYDLMGKANGLPVWRLIGGSDPVVQSDITVSIDEPEAMAATARERVDEGFRIIKMKVGIDLAEDERRVAAVADALAGRAALRVDANQGYGRTAARRMLATLQRVGAEAAEQLLAADDLAGSAELRACAGGVDIMLDEAVHAPADAARACAMRAADVINIKLMKCGGLYPALQIEAICRAFGVRNMVGCMLETPLAITAGLSLAAARANIQDTDCDSYRYYDGSRVPVQGSFSERGDLVTLSDEPGLGVTVDLAF